MNQEKADQDVVDEVSEEDDYHTNNTTKMLTIKNYAPKGLQLIPPYQFLSTATAASPVTS